MSDAPLLIASCERSTKASGLFGIQKVLRKVLITYSKGGRQ